MSFKIILADDHPLILTGVRYLIERIEPHCEVVAEGSHASQVFNLLQQHHCDLLITDFSMPRDTRCDGLVMIRQLRRDYPELSIIVLTQIQNYAIFESMIQLGVSGIILKAAVVDELADAIRQTLLGHRYIGQAVKKSLLTNVDLSCLGDSSCVSNVNRLTVKESEVVRLLASGMSVTQAANFLNRSVKTISTQKKSAMRKLGISSDSALFEFARVSGFI